MDDSTAAIPSAPSPLPTSSMSLSNPNTILSGTYRGNQNVGSAQLNIDSVNNVISVKGVNTLGNSIVKYGQIGTTGSYLGFAVNDGTNDIMFAGEDSTTSPPTTYVKIAKSGFDAKTATNSQLIFNSEQDIFKIVTTGTVSLPSYVLVAGQLRGDLITIPHGLSFTPVLNAYGLVNYYTFIGITGGGGGSISTINAYVQLPYIAFTPMIDSNISAYQILASVDATNLYFSYAYETVSAGSGGSGYVFPATTIRYYVLAETAN